MTQTNTTLPKKILYDNDIDIAPILSRRVAIIGYGNQGRPQALNLRDSGGNVIVGARAESRQRPQAETDGFEVWSLEHAAREADVLMLLLPDESMAGVYEKSVAPFLRKDPSNPQFIGFSHGLVIHAGWLKPDPALNVFLAAPKGQGKGVRGKYLNGSGVPGLYAVHQDPSGLTESVALAYCKAEGFGRVGILPTTFKEETECDLFSEQAVLCGGLTSLIKASFDTLVENGFSPEVAYFECLYEVKLIADLIHDAGLTGMRKAISSTALMGDLTRGERVIDSHVKETLRHILDEITSGRFAEEMKAEFEAGKTRLRTRLEEDYHHPVEETHRRLAEQLRR